MKKGQKLPPKKKPKMYSDYLEEDKKKESQLIVELQDELEEYENKITSLRSQLAEVNEQYEVSLDIAEMQDKEFELLKQENGALKAQIRGFKKVKELSLSESYQQFKTKLVEEIRNKLSRKSD